MADYLDALPDSARTALALAIPSHIPIVILSASSATAAELQERQAWVDQSSAGIHIQIESCGHWIQLERPEAVVSAVQQMISDQNISFKEN